MANTRTEILLKAKNITWMIFDVDGVLTDGRLYFAPNGDEFKVFHVHDGLGIKLLQTAGVTVAILSSRISTAVTNRMEKLGIKHVYQGNEDKNKVFDEIINKFNLDLSKVAYLGDDLPDLPIIERVGLGMCVANAHSLLKEKAIWQTTANGGEGAAREVCELILEGKKLLNESYSRYLDTVTENICSS